MSSLSPLAGSTVRRTVSTAATATPSTQLPQWLYSLLSPFSKLGPIVVSITVANSQKITATESPVIAENRRNQVYDVTPFMDDHPGGDEVILATTGKDATDDFEDVGHSNTAKEMMGKYCIGEIDAKTIPSKRSYILKQQATYNPDKTPKFLIQILQFLVPLLILSLAVSVRYYTKAS